MSMSKALYPAGRLAAALADPARRERNALLVLAGFVVLWTLYGVIAKGGQGVHTDMAELSDLARHFSLGNAKNPPFAMWVASVWFLVFPRADWAFYLLSMLSTAVGLWAAWRLYGRSLDAEKRVAALALITLVPLLTFHALKFNNNALMIPLWALATLFFVRSYEDRALVAAALAGLFAACAVLTKYWSVFLIAGFLAAALNDARRAAYFRSAAPWISMLVGLAVLAPHAVWLYQHGFPSFTYVMIVHGGRSVAGSLKAAVGYLSAAAAYAAVVPVVIGVALRPTRAALAEMLWPAQVERRFIAVLLWTPLLLPVAVALTMGTDIVGLWTMPAWTLLPLLLLSAPAITVARAAATGIAAVALALPLAALVAAPGIGYAIHRNGSADLAAYFQPLAKAVDHEWRQVTSRPLRIVGGHSELAYGAAFYTRDGAMAFPDFSRALAPWIDNAALVRDGVALVCPAEVTGCVENIKGYAGNAPRFFFSEVTLTASYFGFGGVTRHFDIIVVPPRNALAKAQ